MKRTIEASLLLFLAIAPLAICGDGQADVIAPQIPFPTIRDPSSVKITLLRSGCFGTCPSYQVEVHGDGTVLYEGYGYVAVEGQHRDSIPRLPMCNEQLSRISLASRLLKK